MDETIKNAQYTLDQMYNIRAQYEPMWRKLSDYIYPQRGRFYEEDGSRNGQRRDMCLIDPFPTDAIKKCSAGLHSGLTSPSRPWFELSLQDNEKAEFHTVRQWLNNVHDIMMDIYARSNTYNMLYQLDAELPQFGTAACMMYQDYNYGLWHRPYTCGEYAGAVDSLGRVNMLARKMAFNSIQMVSEFGQANVSDRVLHAWGRKDLTTRFQVNMLVQRNEDYNPEKLEAGNFPWKSLYWEPGQHRFLRVSGYHEQPFLMPRWEVIANDIYGTGPGHSALGDCMQVQKLEKNKLHVIDNEADPAMMFPAGAKDVNTSPGAVNYAAEGTTVQAYALVPPGAKRYEGMVALVNEKHQRISSAFYNDLMIMLATADNNPQMTAREVAERHEEKLLMLSPVLEQFHNEVLEPLTLRTFGLGLRNNMFPPMPEEISADELKVNFVSLLAQAQRMVEMPAIEKVLGLAGSLAGVNPEVVDNINFDQALRKSASIYGAPEAILHSEEETKRIRQARAEQQVLAAQQEQIAQAATTAKDVAEGARLMSEADPGHNMLENIFGGLV